MAAKQRAIRGSAPERRRHAVVAGGPTAIAAQAGPRTLAIGPMRLRGELVLGPRPSGLVLIVQCGADGGHGHADRFVAETLQRHRLATLSLDLLTGNAADDEKLCADLALLAGRVGAALSWVVGQRQLAGCRRALFGTGVGGAALLQAAATAPGCVDAVVARGARLELAWSSLSLVRAPTLLITGSDLAQELELHSAALRELQCEKRLEVIPGASPAVPDSGVPDTVAELSAWWLRSHMGHGAVV